MISIVQPRNSPVVTNTQAGRVFRLDADGSLRHWDAGQHIGAVVPRASGGLVVTAGNGFLAMDTGTGEVTPLAPVEADQPATRMNT